MGPNLPNTPQNFDVNVEQHSSWLDMYRRNLAWIKSSVKEDEGTLINDLTSDL